MSEPVSTTEDTSRTSRWPNVVCFFLPALSYIVAQGEEFFLPIAMFAIAAYSSLFSQVNSTKVAARFILAGYLFVFAALALFLILVGIED
jgi:hypothetical protein